MIVIAAAERIQPIARAFSARALMYSANSAPVIHVNAASRTLALRGVPASTVHRAADRLVSLDRAGAIRRDRHCCRGRTTRSAASGWAPLRAARRAQRSRLSQPLNRNTSSFASHYCLNRCLGIHDRQVCSMPGQACLLRTKRWSWECQIIFMYYQRRFASQVLNWYSADGSTRGIEPTVQPGGCVETGTKNEPNHWPGAVLRTVISRAAA